MSSASFAAARGAERDRASPAKHRKNAANAQETTVVRNRLHIARASRGAVQASADGKSRSSGNGSVEAEGKPVADRDDRGAGCIYGSARHLNCQRCLAAYRWLIGREHG